MFDINKTIMRCLVKNLAMFGLGIYIYSGEDLPEGDTVQPQAKASTALAELKIDTDQWAKVVKYVTDNKQLGIEHIIQQLNTKYLLTASVKKEIANIINNG
jgi:hypothetical protein